MFFTERTNPGGLVLHPTVDGDCVSGLLFTLITRLDPQKFKRLQQFVKQNSINSETLLTII